MTCENCIHNVICDSLGALEPTGQCTYYKDRSRFVELPCKVGDTAYLVRHNEIRKGVITSVFMGREYLIADFNDGLSKVGKPIPFHKFGKTVFLTREEAEQVLKEREENA